MGSRRHARINAGIDAVIWLIALGFFGYLLENFSRLMPLMQSAVQEASLSASLCFQAVTVYAFARASESISKHLVRAFSKDASEAGDVREPKVAPADG